MAKRNKSTLKNMGTAFIAASFISLTFVAAIAFIYAIARLPNPFNWISAAFVVLFIVCWAAIETEPEG